MNNLKLNLHDDRIEMSRIGRELCYNVIREGKNNFSGRNIKYRNVFKLYLLSRKSMASLAYSY